MQLFDSSSALQSFINWVVSGAAILILVLFAKRISLVRRLLRLISPTRADEIENEVAAKSEIRNQKIRQLATDRWNSINRQVRSAEFRNWQLNYVKSIHAEAIQEFSQRTRLTLPTIGFTQYPIVCFTAESGFPGSHTANALGRDFDDARHVDIDPTIPLLPKDMNPGTDLEKNLRNEYFALLTNSGTVTRWNQRGFELSSFEILSDGQIANGRSALITYAQNCLTSHFLGYVHHLAYEEDQQIGSQASSEQAHNYIGLPQTALIPTIAVTENGAVNYLPRSAAGGNNSTSSEGAFDFHPLISVQALVLFRDRGEWNVWTMRRSENVSAMAGFWQFPPAGGFEIFGPELADDSEVKRQFNLDEAITREFLEEIYNDSDLTSDNAGATMMGIRQSPGFSEFNRLRTLGDIEVHLCGAVLDLVSLRTEYSFLIVVEDSTSLQNLTYGTSGWGRGSSESSSLHDVPLSELAEMMTDPSHVWNPGSAGMYALFAQLAEDERSWLRLRWPDMCLAGR